MEAFDIVTVICSILGSALGILGCVFSVFSYQRNRFETVNAFFQYMSDDQFIQARKFVYNLSDNTKILISSPEEENKKVATITNAYHHWGLLVKHKQLPLWIFYDNKTRLTSSGISVIRLYKKLEPTIRYRRENGNPKYAEYFEYLYVTLIKKEPSYINLIH